MMLKLKLISITFISSLILLLVLCLGSQNLKDRHILKLSNTVKTVPLPTGFLVGVSIITGVITIGTATALITPDDNQN